MFISAYQQYIFAYQDFCLSAFMPIIIFISLMHLQHPNQTSNFCYFLADYWQGFFYDNFSSEKQKLNTKSLSKAENQKKKLYCEILNKSTAEIKVPLSNGGFKIVLYDFLIEIRL